MESRRSRLSLTEGGCSYPPSLNSSGGSENPPSVEEKSRAGAQLSQAGQKPRTPLVLLKQLAILKIALSCQKKVTLFPVLPSEMCQNVALIGRVRKLDENRYSLSCNKLCLIICVLARALLHSQVGELRIIQD